VVAVVAGTVFSAISGSTIATTAMLGSLMVPVMLSRGYHPTLATGPVMAIGAVDMLIPPSALTVLLGSLSGISISKLLIGGVVPGLVLALAFVAWIIVRVRITPSLAPQVALVRHEASTGSSPSCSTCCRWSRSSAWSSGRWRRAGARPPNRRRSARWRRSCSRSSTAR
jgi:TRAP-type mannitol/chloroaromatic compound transport system permease large subunit